jgi:ATP-binding cassette, subfamily B, bacterial
VEHRGTELDGPKPNTENRPSVRTHCSSLDEVSADPPSPWGFLFDLVRRQKRTIAVFGAVLSIATLIPLASTMLLKRFIDLAAKNGTRGQLVLTAAAFACLGLLSGLVSVLVTWRANVAAWSITNGLRVELTDDVLRADLSFHRDRTPGELVTRVDGDVTAMTQFLASVVAPTIAIGALAIGAVIVSLFVQPIIAPSLIVGLGFVVLTMLKVRDLPMQETIAERTVAAEFMSSSEQFLAGAEDLSSLGAGRFAVARTGEQSARIVTIVREKVLKQMASQGAIRMSTVVSELLMLATGAWLFAADRLSIGGVVFGYRLAAMVSADIYGLTWRINESQDASGAAARVMELTRLRGQVRSGHEMLPTGGLSVVFDNVSLTYDDEAGTKAALQSLNLTIPAGRSLGVVGRTGSGKTSLARLLLRLAETTDGRLLVGGVPIDDLDDDSFRTRVTAVPQDVQLFPGSVLQNVTLFADRTEGEVTDALELVGLGNWLAGLPDGLHTMLGNDDRDAGGTRTGVSAGQAQLLALSRALLRNPSVVILDEATSRIDPVTQATIQYATAQLLAGRTSLVIAHRLETLDMCDDIVVLDHGRIVEYGQRDQLTQDPASRYAHLRSIGEEAEELR